MLHLEKQIEDTGLDNNSKDIEDNCGDEEHLLNLKKGGFQRKNPQAEAIPNNSKQNIKDNQSNSFKERIKHGWRMKVKEPEYNCLKCDFQGTRQEELDKHIQLKHSSQGMMKCRNCGKEFESKSCLMVHRKTEHRNTVAQCRNKLAGHCYFSGDDCWWNHKEENEQNIECYFCENTFRSRGSVMMHRKKEHSKTVKPCSKYLDSKCIFGEETCWFKHGGKEEKDENTRESECEPERSVFQEVSNDLEPPLTNL